MSELPNKILLKPRERTAILESLRQGMVPNIGLQHIQVGRSEEINEILKDYDLILNGGSKTRFIVGQFGSGKTFFLTLCKLIAHKKNLVVMNADVSMEKVLSSSNSSSRALFSELVTNISTRTKPQGGALSTIVESWASEILAENPDPDEAYIVKILKPLEKYTNCYDFAKVLATYIKAYQNGNDIMASLALRWLRAEYSTKTEARQELNVRTIIDDQNFYDYLKLYSGFVRLAGYSGLVVAIDELAVLARLRPSSRGKNYEKILSILNDTTQGETAEYLEFIFSGTPEFLEDKNRGMFSYEALKSRLQDSPFAAQGHRDLTQPVIRLPNLLQEELYVLFSNIRNVFASYDKNAFLVSDDDIKTFMTWLLGRLGAKAYMTPRESIRIFVGLLSLLERNPNTDIGTYLKDVNLGDTEEAPKADLSGSESSKSLDLDDLTSI